MSRIGKQPIVIPESVTVAIAGQEVTATGPQGELMLTVHPAIAVRQEDRQLICAADHPSGEVAALWGTTRARLSALVQGVSQGWRKQLELHGIGYRASVKGSTLELQVGFSHPVVVMAPSGITFTVDENVITVSGPDKVLVGQVAADIRAIRKPEPYKGKGIRYVGEVVRRKVGKVMAAAQ